MSPLIRKEIRLLLPFFGIALVLAVVPAWILPEQSYIAQVNDVVFWVFGFGVLLLSLASFGEEFTGGTFPSLLAQPVRRQRIWTTKILLVVAAAVLVLLVFIFSVHLRLDSILKSITQRLVENQGYRPWNLTVQKSIAANLHLFVFWRIGLLAVLVGLAGGLWSTLLFRQMGAALWFAILIPGVLLIAVQWIFQSASDQVQETTAAAVLVCYAVIGVVWAYRMFLRAQDAQWLGGSISLPGLRPTRAWAQSVEARPQSPFLALLWKEIQCQQITFLIAFGILVLHVCTLATRKFFPPAGNSQLRFALEAVPFLWLLLPWLAGSVAVAEERKLGTHESQLCLPVKRWRQFAVKFCITLVIGFVLGGIFPWLIEHIGFLCHVPRGIFRDNAEAAGTSAESVFIFCALTFVLVSFFASTFTRNTLHALGLAIVFGAAAIALDQWVITQSQNAMHYYSLWKGPLVFIIGVPVAAVATVWLSFSNYKLLQVRGKAWLRNFLVLSLSLVLAGTATALIYQRPWELAMTLEPKHGPARLSGPVRPAVCAARDRVFALLPDGRLWVAVDYHWKQLNWYVEGRMNRPQRLSLPVPTGGVFVGGSNWIALAASRSEVVAIQSDGSLWRILSWREKTNSWNWRSWVSLSPELRRIGSDSDWKCLKASFGGFRALKSDGTLWRWGQADWADVAQDYIRDPVRIGTDSDWAAIFPLNSPVFMKDDGSIWAWVQSKTETGPRNILAKTRWNGSDWLMTAGSPGREFFLHKDGTLWACGRNLPSKVFGTDIRSGYIREPVRIGHGADWTQIAAGDWDMVGIKKDGRLVESERELFSGILGQPSKYSDWIAVDAQWDGLVGLAADGTVSYWSVYDRTGEGGLLGPTHRPLWSLNVLENSSSSEK